MQTETGQISIDGTETGRVDVESYGRASKGKRNRSILVRNVLFWVRDITIALLIAIVIMQFVKPTIVQQSSMENTLHQNDYIFLNKQAYTFGSFERGDIIVFHSNLPRDEMGGTKNLIKRVIGLPGDKIAISDGKVSINGVSQDEPYTKDGYTAGDMDEETVPAKCLFVMGDNRQNSEDSRSPQVGFVQQKQVVGKAIFRLYPFDKIGAVH